MAKPTLPPLKWWEWLVGLGVIPLLFLMVILLIAVVLALVL